MGVGSFDFHGFQCGVATVTVDEHEVFLSSYDGPNDDRIFSDRCSKFIAAFGKFCRKIVASFTINIVHNVRIQFEVFDLYDF